MQTSRPSVTVEVREKDRVLFTGSFDQFPVVFGRAEHCHVSIPGSGFLSRVHGVILIDEGRIFVNDLNSKNGLSFLDGSPFLQADFGDAGTFTIKGELVFSLRRVMVGATVLEDAGSAETVVTRPPLSQRPPGVSLQTSKANVSPAEENSFNTPVRPMEVPSRPVFAPMAKPVASAKPKSGGSSAGLEMHSTNIPSRAERLAKINRFLAIETPLNLRALKPAQVTLQGVLSWGDDILDVRQFRGTDVIWVGGAQQAPIYVPGYSGKMVLGRVSGTTGKLKLKTNVRWTLNRSGVDFSPQDATTKGIAKSSGDSMTVDLAVGDRFLCEVAPNVSLHLRYVEKNRFFIKRDWIENREEFKKAFQISAVLHAITALVLVFSTPKVHAPDIEDVPVRFAKLIVDPPKTPLAPPPTPTPEPVKVVEAPKPEPTPIKAPEPLPKPIPKKEKPQKVAKEKPKTKAKPKVEKTIASVPPPPEPPKAPEPPKPSAEEIAAKELMNALSDMPAPPKAGGSKSLTIKNEASVAGLAGQPGLKTEGLAGVLKSKNGKLGPAGGGVVGGVSGPKVGQVGYSNGPMSGVTGTRGVSGMVVGTPKLEDFVASSNGLSQDEVMKIVNKSLSAIHRCYERALLNDSNLVGRVEYEWNITPQGKVTGVRVKRSEISNSDSLNSCVIKVFQAMKFPAAKNKQPTTANIGFPFGKEG